MRVVNFADGFTMEKPPMTSGAVQEEFELLNNKFDWTLLEGFSFDKNEVSSASVTMEVSRFVEFGVDSLTHRQKATFELLYNGEEWTLSRGSFSGEDLWQDDALTTDQSIQFKIDPLTGDTYYKSGYLVVDSHIGKFKFATVRMKA